MIDYTKTPYSAESHNLIHVLCKHGEQTVLKEFKIEEIHPSEDPGNPVFSIIPNAPRDLRIVLQDSTEVIEYSKVMTVENHAVLVSK